MTSRTRMLTAGGVTAAAVLVAAVVFTRPAPASTAVTVYKTPT